MDALTPTSYSLKDFLSSVKEVLADTFDGIYWVRAEISELRENANGNCYLSLIDKGIDGRLIEAKVSAVIWKSIYNLMKPYFYSMTGQMLAPGMKVLVAVTLSFHEQYGLQLNIREIDPSFTLGDMARKRQETIAQLKADGVWDMNRQVEYPVPARRIAVISSGTAAGYGDFCDQLMADGNRFGFAPTLFQAVMQGERTIPSIIAALEAIYGQIEEFDVVAIIRGGGATTDMAAFDDYDLASNVANFPLPIITGIGHDRDESVVDMVAAVRCKTPTAVAAYLVEAMMDLEAEWKDMGGALSQALRRVLTEETRTLDYLTHTLSGTFRMAIQQAMQNVDLLGNDIATAFKTLLRDESHRLELMEKSLSLVSPEAILKKGYSLTMCDGKVVTHVSALHKGEKLITYLSDGKVESVIDKTEKYEEGDVL